MSMSVYFMSYGRREEIREMGKMMRSDGNEEGDLEGMM